MKSTILTKWQYQSKEANSGWVYPDGCRDVIVRYGKGKAPAWTITAIDATARVVENSAETHLVGFRLHPGTLVRDNTLLAQLQTHHHSDLDVPALINELTTIDHDLQDALQQLSRRATSVEAVAKASGVSTRTLQRKMTATLGKPPSFWLALARVRKAAKLLPAPQSLAAIAHDCGYADQAHLQREIKRWYRRTPTQLRKDPAQLSIITAKGYS